MSEEQIPVSNTTKDLPIGIKVLLRVLSVLLCLCLFASMASTVLILDFQQVTDRDTIQKIVSSMLSAPPHPHLPQTAAVGAPQPTQASADEQTQQELVAWLYSTLKEQHGDELVVTQEQMQTFLEQSTTKKYLTEKIASYMDDFINGTNNTTITAEELTWLMEENNAAIEAELGVKMDEAAQKQVLAFVEKMNIGEVIRTEVIEGVENLTIPGGSPLFPENAPAGPDAENSAWGGSYTVGALMADLRILTSTSALLICIAINILLIVALFFANRMRLSATLCCTGIPMTLLGTLVALPTALLQLVPALLPAPLGSAVAVVVGVIAPIHYAVLGLGIAALIAAIVTKALQKK